jgi:hypothetical protein
MRLQASRQANALAKRTWRHAITTPSFGEASVDILAQKYFQNRSFVLW